MIVSPQAHAAACDLLGLPRESKLTVAQFYEAASLEAEQQQQRPSEDAPEETP